MSIAKEFTIEQLIEKFEGAKTIIHEYGSLPRETVLYKLNPETWSCVEVCQHLIQFNKLYINQMNSAIEKLNAIPAAQNGHTFSPKWSARKLAGYMEPPYSFGIKTVKPMKPDGSESDPAETIERLIEVQDELIELLKRADSENWDLDKIKGRHPLIKLLRLSLTDFLIIMDAHQRRHIWQIEQILKRIPQ
ncbi:DinB family protein [Rhodohalobacter sp. SW132]|uniref:DinB family protein n=1 Tax=Rhodohalobacter sp. SW132 TaxID=2293433 RepID=UPI000E22250D|nr:DinB family protein [Rhodohalobacter sp. SW132]REL24992.1 DinB family protein [Rhodohalobacter sp. SW132]